MKKVFALLLISIITFSSCGEDNDDNLTINSTVTSTFNFTHNWDGDNIASTSNTLQYTNAHGETLSIERLRYLISDVTFTKANGEEIVINGYNLVDLTNNTNLSYSPSTEIPVGEYSNVSFTFGFDAEDNTDGTYPDLNSVSWNVPNTPMLGSIGGYHYMQLEGKYINIANTETGYAYHAIRAADVSTTPTTIVETAINVNLGPTTISNDVAFEVKMNVAEWFKSPYEWDLNVLDNMLMPNFDAQEKMNLNGQNVFSLGNITQ